MISRPRMQKRDSFLMGQGSAMLFPIIDPDPKIVSNQLPNTIKVGPIEQHLEVMCGLLRQDDTIALAVRLECAKSQRSRYFLLTSNSQRLEFGENIILGVDIKENKSEQECTIGLVLPVWSDTQVFLDGDGGFSVTSGCRTCLFKPVSVQVMWTVLQSLHKACEEASQFNHYPGGSGILWANYYMDRITSSQKCINEWNAMADLLSVRPESPGIPSTPTERDLTERRIRSGLRIVMVDMDLEKATSKEIRTALELHMKQELKEYKGFIDNEMLLVLAQMDKPSKIFDYLYLGSEWNASNLEELEQNGVGYVLNVTREIDNFFPARFEYLNIRVYDEEGTDLLSQWEQSYRFILSARSSGSRCLVHCKMGVSRSASTVMAYAMKEYDWDLEQAYAYVKERRRVVKPNSGFLNQLRIYQGILNASKQRHNFLWRSCSEPDLAELSEEAAQGEGPRRSQDDSDTGTRLSGQLLHSPRPRSPSASPLRPHSPSASLLRPHSPSASPLRPHSPSASPLRPHSPSASPLRPHSPSSSPPGPRSPLAYPLRPHSPSASPPRPDSPSATPPSHSPASAYLFRPLRESPGETPAPPPLSPRVPSIHVREAPGPAGGGPEGGEQLKPGLWAPEPLTPSLREKIDLLTLMWQVKEMERLQEASDCSSRPPASQRALAWRRRAYSVQVSGLEEHDWSKVSPQPESSGAGDLSWPRSPGARPRRDQRKSQGAPRHLHHYATVDLTEEEEEEEEGKEEGDLLVTGETLGATAHGVGLHAGVRPGAEADDGGGGGGGGGKVRVGPGLVTLERPAFKHRDSVAALQEAGLVSRRRKEFVWQGVPAEEEPEDTPSQ
ncbi:protein phosphatase Slingshot homolog 3-like [Carcharodon carcharias]|uniref:protein phosphatase Slingshot homolog 3-like n=1 Tax=Carcharodon carcharias TaxID=13397 RepID=UPI001B7DB7AF|nr:protein phosphatase Slingshot homolog 3-like [Carcharodon carcharias]